jgi:competence protein ComEC
VTEVRRSEHGAWAIMRVRSVDGRAVRERAVLRLPADDAAVPAPELGEGLRVRVTARPLDDDGFDAHLRRLHAVASLDPVGPVAVREPAGRLWRTTSWLRSRARDVAGARLDDDPAAILTGVLIGDVTGQSPQRRAQLADAGLTHLVVVSGRHVGLLLAGVLGLAVLLRAVVSTSKGPNI